MVLCLLCLEMLYICRIYVTYILKYIVYIFISECKLTFRTNNIVTQVDDKYDFIINK